MSQPNGDSDQIVIVQASATPARQIAGVHIATWGDLVAIAVDFDPDDPPTLTASEPVILVRNWEGQRTAVRATFIRTDRDGLWFNVPGHPWRVVEERPVVKRIPLDDACEVVGATLGESVKGKIMDISEGGARIAVPEHVGESRLNLQILEAGDDVSLPAVLLACVKVEKHSELRVRFDKLTRPQELAVRRYVERWVKEKKAS